MFGYGWAKVGLIDIIGYAWVQLGAVDMIGYNRI